MLKIYFIATIFATICQIKCQNYPNCVGKLNQFLEIDDQIYAKFKQSQTNSSYQFNIRQKEIIQDFITNFEKVPEKLRKFRSHHPLIIYQIMQRYYDFPKALLYPFTIEIENIFSEWKLNWPERSDLLASLDAIIRLADAYDLNLKKVRNGQISNKKIDKMFKNAKLKLNAQNLYYLGKRAGERKFAASIEWLELAKKMINAKDTSISLGLVEKTLSDVILQHDQEFKNDGLWNEIFFDKPFFVKSNSTRIKRKALDRFKVQKGEKSDIFEATFYALCKGEDLRTEKMKSKLHCKYTTSDHYYFPSKIEILSIDPKIIQFYEVLSDREINQFKSITINNLKPHKYENEDNPVRNIDFVTKSVKSFFGTNIDSQVHPNAISLAKKVDFLTKLTTSAKFSSELQIAAYTPGGHYGIHNDLHSEKDLELENPIKGNRIATFMIYLSEDEHLIGGSTAFIHGLVSAKPIKGSAIFWLSSYRNGSSDLRSDHGGCPVLYDHKWIANIWINYNPQFKSLPCSLNRNE